MPMQYFWRPQADLMMHLEVSDPPLSDANKEDRMTDHGYMLKGDARSMSSLASTILRVSPGPLPSMPKSSSDVDISVGQELAPELTIPLPPSSACSDDGYSESPNQHPDFEPDSAMDRTTEENEDHGQENTALLGSQQGDLASENQDPLSPVEDLNSSPTLSRIRSLVGLEKTNAERTLLLLKKLRELRLQCSLERRLLNTLTSAYRLMSEQFRSKDQPGFVQAFDACERLVENTKAIYKSTVEDNPYGDDGAAPNGNIGQNRLDSLSTIQTEALLCFMTQLRNDPGYLASCLCKLPSADFLSLTSSSYPQSPVTSVLPTYVLGKAQGQTKEASSQTTTHSIANMENLCQDDPFFTIFHGLFDASPTSGAWEYRQRIEVLSTACASVMIAGKRGSDDLAIRFLDACSGLKEKGAQSRLEVYLLKVLQDGTSILDPSPGRFGSSEQPLEIHNANSAIANANFFDSCSTNFFSLLANELPHIVTTSTIDFVQAVLGKIEDPTVRTRAKNFIVSRWFFSSFMSTVLIYPESRALLLNHHIGETARDGLLKALAVQIQKQVLEVLSPWNHHTFVDPKVRFMIEKILSYFEPNAVAAVPKTFSSSIASSTASSSYSSLLVSSRVAVGLIRTLLPQAPPSPVSTDLSYGENTSTAPSTAASSTLTTGSVGFTSGLPSSMAPSISGTSMTSTTMLSDYPSAGRECGQDQAEGGTIQEQASSGNTIDGLSVTTVEACHSISATIDNNEKLNLESDGTQWLLLEVGDGGERLSIEANDVLMHKVSDQAEEAWTDDSRYHLDELEEAISLVLGNLDLLSENAMFYGSLTNDAADALKTMMQAAKADCESQFDYCTAHFWWRNIETIHDLELNAGSDNAFNVFISQFVHKKERHTKTQHDKISLISSQINFLEIVTARQDEAHQVMITRLKGLRDKMWYITDVKHSAAYEDALNATQALRTMLDSRRSPRKQPATTNWARQRLRSPESHDRISRQTLESLASPKEYGGISKLADVQVEATTRWMTKNSIESFCKGEELIHRFCYEVQRCANKLAAASMLDSPVLWSSQLYRSQKTEMDNRRTNTKKHNEENRQGFSSTTFSSFKPSLQPAFTSASRSLVTNAPKPFQGFWHASKPTSHLAEGIPFFTQQQHNQKSNFASPSPMGSLNELKSQLLPSFSRGGSLPSKAHEAFAKYMKKLVTALLLSDLGHALWSRGTETDIWINQVTLYGNAGSRLLQQTSQSADLPLNLASISTPSDALSDSTITIQPRERLEANSLVPLAQPDKFTESSKSQTERPDATNRKTPYAFTNAFAKLLSRFSSTLDPLTKLDLLAELESIVLVSLGSMSHYGNRQHRQDSLGKVPTHKIETVTPRTKATSLEEVMANCTERRAGTMRYSAPGTSRKRRPPFQQPGTDEVVAALLDVLRNDEMRPQTLYRDLQFIAAFVPSEILDQSAKGKAFWDFGLAALAYKEERCEAMIHRANQITNYHVSANKDTNSFMNAYASDLINTNLSDAAQLWVTIAKEGSPVACRELGLFYLTHPELLPRVTLPFSKSKDVFRSVTVSDRTSIDTGGLDPLTFAVVFHWMELAANGGDKDARDFIRGNGELSAGR